MSPLKPARNVKTAYLGLGSNLGDRRARLAGAMQRLERTAGLRIVAVSSVYETTPVGVTGQPDYLNLAAAIATSLAPTELLAECQRIESALGRVRLERWAPRTIDLDLLWYEDFVSAIPELTVPHPRMLERGFVMVPLAEIAPNLILAGETMLARAARIDRSGVRQLDRLDWTEPRP